MKHGILLIALLVLFSWPAPTEAIMVQSMADQYGRPNVIAWAGDQPLRLLLDTGASIDVIRPEVYRALGGGWPVVGRMRITGFSGTVIYTPIRAMPSLRVGGCVLDGWRVMIYDASIGPSGAGGISGLLSSAALRELGPVTIDVATGTVAFQNCEEAA